MLPSGQKSTDQPGFQAQLRGASLWDLVQMECLAMSHRVVRITTVDDIGYLFFSGGQIVHARTKTLEGDAAAMSVLSWDEGSFEVVEQPWPSRETINCAWQSLVMRAAQNRDEGERTVANLVAFPNRASDAQDPSSEAETSSARSAQNSEGAAAKNEAKGGQMSSDLQVMVQLSADGTMLSSAGTGAEDFSAMAAYATQLARLVGDGLGIDGFQEIECEFKTGRCLIYLDESGNTVGVKPIDSVPMSKVREHLGLK